MTSLLWKLKGLRSNKNIAALSEWYHDKMGYRRMGLYFDDLVPEEHTIVQEALRRLPPKELYDRHWRVKRALVYSVRQDELPRHLWTKPEEDRRYLTPIIDQIENEMVEKASYDNMTSIPEHLQKRNKLALKK